MARLVRELAHERVPRNPLGPAPTTPPVLRRDPIRQHRSIRLEALPHHDEAELVNAGARGQVKGQRR
jgi:hypothetical protein